MKSPCIKECIYDGEIDRCTGCWRTLEEIVFWTRMTDVEKQEVLDRIETDEYRQQTGK